MECHPQKQWINKEYFDLQKCKCKNDDDDIGQVYHNPNT